MFEQPVANLPGKSLIAVEVTYPPGVASAPHSHPGSAFIYAYVLSGEIASAVDDEEPRVYRAGESGMNCPERVTASLAMPARPSRRNCSRSSSSIRTNGSW